MSNKLFVLIAVLFTTNAIAASNVNFRLELDLARNATLLNKGGTGDKDFSLSKFKDESTKTLNGTSLYGAKIELTWNKSNYLFSLGGDLKLKNFNSSKYFLNDARDVQEDVLKTQKTSTEKKLVEHLYTNIYAKTGYDFESKKFSAKPMLGLGYRKEVFAVVYKEKTGSVDAKVSALAYGSVFLTVGGDLDFNLNKNWGASIGADYIHPFNSTTDTYGIAADEDITGFTKAKKEISQSSIEGFSLKNISYKIRGSFTKYFAEGDYGLDGIGLSGYFESFKLERAKDSAGNIIAPKFNSNTAGICLSFIF